MTVTDRQLDEEERADQGELEAQAVDDLPVPDEVSDEYAEYDDERGYVPDEVPPIDDGPPDAGPQTAPRSVVTRQHVVGSVLLARLGAAGLWLLVVAAVVMAALALLLVGSLRTRDTPVEATGEDAVVAPDAVAVSGFAQAAVRRYVGEAGEDTEEVVAPFLADRTPNLRGVTPAGFYVVDATTVDLQERADGYWAVTVALDLMAAVDERYEPIGMRYYTVGVVTGDDTGGPLLVDLPSQVPAPETPEAPGLATGELSSPDEDDPRVTAVREFLGALLLGDGSIQRYTAPGTKIPPIDPPPFAELELDEIAVADPDADRTVARASVLAVDENGLAQRLNYTVDLRLRDGRWEVAELFDAPPLAEE
jgi:hypothetical protein